MAKSKYSPPNSSGCGGEPRAPDTATILYVGPWMSYHVHLITNYQTKRHCRKTTIVRPSLETQSPVGEESAGCLLHAEPPGRRDVAYLHLQGEDLVALKELKTNDHDVDIDLLKIMGFLCHGNLVNVPEPQPMQRALCKQGNGLNARPKHEMHHTAP